MYLTTVYKNKCTENFDWESYFKLESSSEIIDQIDHAKIISILRKHLKEDKFRLTFVMTKLLRDLLKGIEIKSPTVLELGAATGFLTRWIIGKYGGRGTLVDKSKASYEKYISLKDSLAKYITYLNEDIFEMELHEKFDLVCSFGLVEHFVEKQAVISVHKEYVAANGFVLILVPLDSPLTRVFLEIHPELNLGYRELLSEKEFKEILNQNGLRIIRTKKSQGYCYDFIGAICCGN